jgi:ankyrin repeat protein
MKYVLWLTVVSILALTGCDGPRESAAAGSSNGAQRSGRGDEPAVRVSGPIPREHIDANDVAMVKKLIRGGADVNAAYDEYNMNALHVATAMGGTAVLEALLEHGADPNAASTVGETPLMNTCFGDKAASAELLLAHGADPNARNIGGESALMYAARMGSAETARVLLRHGADMDAGVPGGDTPLIMAAQQGQAKVVRVLVDHGADLDARNADGRTALELAREKGRDDVVAILEAGEIVN